MLKASFIAAALFVFGTSAAIAQADLKPFEPTKKLKKLNRGNDAVFIGSNVNFRRIDNIDIKGAFRVIETKPGTVISDSEISNINAVDVQRDCIRLRKAERVVISNVFCRHADLPNTPPNLPEGLAIIAGSDIVVQDSEFSGFQMNMDANRYWNGDGIAAEGTVDGLRIERVLVQDNSDGGVDLKAKNAFLDQVTARRNTRNFRFWESAEAGTLISEDPMSRGGKSSPLHIWVLGRGQPKTLHIKNLIAKSATSAPLLVSEGGFTTFIIDECDIDIPDTAKILLGPGKIIAGPKCSLTQ
ncbi:hypothetical protein [Sphingobium phenoxybenzoativorans]|uniref:hypothetical protein n=1 Tax=Sphingobium phenoxybenzoativorans TaxID=1592790 RepID=UPI0008725B8E|nr:hypothetical protein [Sphingobium phenoxybenzoativorans]